MFRRKPFQVSGFAILCFSFHSRQWYSPDYSPINWLLPRIVYCVYRHWAAEVNLKSRISTVPIFNSTSPIHTPERIYFSVYKSGPGCSKAG